MFFCSIDELLRSPRGDWALVYATVDSPFASSLARLSAALPKASIFGATSFQGVLTPHGFERGCFALVGTDADPRARHVARTTTAIRARVDARSATHDLVAALGGRPDVLLLHASPGYEERLLEGVDEAFEGRPPPLYGGSAADDDLSGKWKVIAGGQTLSDGFVLTGFRSPREISGSFVAGYAASSRRGRVTEADGRTIRTIDHRPAAHVYDEWLGGALKELLATGGNVLSRTTLHPLGRAIDKVGQVQRYLLSHPHRIHPDGSLSLFTDVAVGDQVVLMLGSEDALVDRTEQVAERAGRRGGDVRGAVLVYCAGCVGAIGGRAKLVAERFQARIGRAPFLGAATFGEQGCFVGAEAKNRHGNLMCDAVMFG